MTVNTTTGADVDVLKHLASPEFWRDPVSFLHRLREEQPVHRTSKGFYLVSRYADVAWLSGPGRDVVLRPDRARMMTEFPAARTHRSMNVLLDSLVMSNPPEHTRRRGLIGKAFTQDRVNRLRHRVEGICERILDTAAEPLLDGEQIDLHHAWSMPVTLEVFGELLGVPEADRDWLGAAVVHISDGIASADEELMTAADEQTEILERYFADLVAERRREPKDDLVSALASALDEDPDLDEHELIVMLWFLWLAGFESSASLLDQCALAVFRHPEEARWLRGGPKESLAFADEVLRHNIVQLFTPVPRITAEDIELSGVVIPAGSDVRPVIAAANRDPAKFTDPDRFDPSRDNAPTSATFGFGIHRCTGAFLARTELAIGTAALHARFPRLTAAAPADAGGRGAVWNDDILTVRLTRSFPVKLAR